MHRVRQSSSFPSKHLSRRRKYRPRFGRGAPPHGHYWRQCVRDRITFFPKIHAPSPMPEELVNAAKLFFKRARLSIGNATAR